MTRKPGLCIDLWDGREVRSALLLGEEKGRVRVITVQGRELKVPEARLANVGGKTLAVGGDPVAIGATLRERDADFQARVGEIDLESVWQVVCDEDGAYDLDELADLTLGARGGEERSLILRRMLTDELYFHRKKLAFRPRTREELGETVARLRASESRAEQREAFVAVAKERLHHADEAPRAWPDGAPRFLGALLDLAVHNLESQRLKEAQALLKDIDAPGRSEPGLCAFDILLRLGEVDPDENLLLRKHSVKREFPAEVLEQAASVAAAGIDRAGRRDLTAVDCWAIDDAHTTEVDDALSFELRPDGGLRLGVHIADPEPYLPIGGLIDEAARDRGTTFYLPRERILMLPPDISEGIASLTAGVERTALSVEVELAPDGEVESFEIFRSLIRVTRRLTYEEADALIALGGGAPALYEKADEFTPPAVTDEIRTLAPSDVGDGLGQLLAVAARMAHTLLERRAAAGALILKGPDLWVKAADDGEVSLQRIEPWTPAWVLVSEAMVLANWLAARTLRDANVAAVFRRQKQPDQPVKVPRAYDPAAAAQARRRIKPSEMSLEPGPHAGLGIDVYVQCSSPLRRYQDLVCHRQLVAVLEGETPPYERDQLWAIVQGCSETEKAAREIERGNRVYWLMKFLERLPDDQVIEATITRPDERRTLIELYPWTYFAQLPPRSGHRPGRKVQVRVETVNPRANRLGLREV